MLSPLVSIILPVYNGEKYLEKAIASCLQQTYANLELIIIDDGSIDDSLKIAEGFSKNDSRIRIHKNQENMKLPVSLNIGHKLAKGDYLTWTSHDNIYHNESIENLISVLINYKVDVVYSNYLNIDHKGSIKGVTYLPELEYQIFHGVIGANFIYSRSFFNRNGGYDENLYKLEDFDFWLRGLKHGKFLKISNPGFYSYRFHEDSLTHDIQNNIETQKQFRDKLLEVYEKNVFSSKTVSLKNEILVYLINWQRDLNSHKVLPIKHSKFLKELQVLTNDFTGLSFRKLKRIIVNECIQVILRNRDFQTIRLFKNLHVLAGSEILEIPVNTYLALWKKCIFKI